jgi:hypothetical protein
VLGWILGLVLAIVIAALAYLYYEVSVAIVLGGIGFVLGTGLMAAPGVTWSWVVVPVGVAVGLVLAVIAILADLPAILLVVLTALGGAATIVGGVMLLVGTVDLDELDRGTTERVELGGWWYALQIGLAIAGVVAQARDAARRQRLEQTWRRSDWRA